MNFSCVGSYEEQEYFGEILLGIKQVIQNHLKEIQGKFYEKFTDLEDEVKRRDEIIEQLQFRIHELEYGTDRIPSIRQPLRDTDSKERPGSSASTASSNELLFMVSNFFLNSFQYFFFKFNKITAW